MFYFSYSGCCTGCKKGFDEVAEECGKLKEQIMQINCQRCLKKACSIDNVKKKLPITKWLPKYRYVHKLFNYIVNYILILKECLSFNVFKIHVVVLV